MKWFFKGFSNQIGIDFGTTNILVYLRDFGIVINEPSVVAVNTKTGRVVAVGKEAKNMIGRAPVHISVISPVVDGVISDYELATELLTLFIASADKMRPCLFRPTVMIGVPVGVTHVEMRSVYDAAVSSSARKVLLVEEPILSALGAKLPIEEAVGNMILDMGGGSTDIAIMALSGIVNARSVKIGGDKFNDDIIMYLRRNFKLHVGIKTAEEAKEAIGSAFEFSDRKTVTVKGRDFDEGMPKEVIVTSEDIRLAIKDSLSVIVEKLKEVLYGTEPEVLADIVEKGIFVVGGGASLIGLDEYLKSELRIPVTIVEAPLTATCRGTGVIFESLKLYNGVIISNIDDVSIL